MRSWFLAALALMTGTLAHAADAPALSGDGRVLVADGAIVQLPCAGRSLATSAGTTWVACDDAIVVVTGGMSTVVRMAQPVDGIVLRDGVPWVLLRELRLVPLDPSAVVSVPVPTTSSGSTSTAPPPRQEDRPLRQEDRPAARILADDKGLAVLSGGAGVGLHVGDHVEILERIERAGVAMDVPRTVGRVVGASQDAALVQLGVNEQVPIGATARFTKESRSKTFLAPRRIGGRAFAGVGARGLVSMSDTGGGIRMSGVLGYRFKFPLAVELHADPADLAGNGSFNFYGRVTVTAYASFDHSLFAIGLGGGIAVMPSGTWGVFGQHLRLGAVDGFMSSTWVQFASVVTIDDYNDYGQELLNAVETHRWKIDQIDSTIQIPLAVRPPVWLELHGGGGAGHWIGELGVKIRVRDAHEQSLALTPWIGALGMHDTRYRTSQADYPGTSDFLGPSVGISMDAVF